MFLDELSRHARVKRYYLPEPKFSITGISHDSRQVGPEIAFFAVQGLHTDGHQFVGDALTHGARVLILSDEDEFETWEKDTKVAGILLVNGGRKALAELSAVIYGHPAKALRMLAVTGTNGKTTVSFLVAQMLAAMGRSCGILGSLGMRLAGQSRASSRTTAEAPEIHHFLSEVRQAVIDTACMEVTSIGIELSRTHDIPFRAAAFTNLTLDHLDFHGTMSAYKAAKFRLFLEQPLKTAVINLDDPVGMELAERIQKERPEVNVLTYALDQKADIMAKKITLDAQGCAGELIYNGRTEIFRNGLLGKFNLYNLMAAAGLLLAVGEDWDAIGGALSRGRGVDGRFELVQLDAPFSVVVDYAHTPDALENVLRTARALNPTRLIVLFGCGGDRDREKRPVMATIAERHADQVIVTSDNPRGERPEAIIAEIMAGLANHSDVITIADRREAIGRALEIASEGDLILLAGKGHETYQIINGQQIPFDDRVVTRELWGLLKA